MTELELRVPDAEAQQRLGAALDRVLGRARDERRSAGGEQGSEAVSVHLQGDLGTGKTTLVRGLLRGRGHAGAVRSPTFTLVEPYDTPRGRVYHLDLYRLAEGEELEYLGLRDLLAEPALLLIEWPERGSGWLPPPDLHIELHHAPEGRLLRLRPAPSLAAETARAVRGSGSEDELRK